jgi:putative flippase GtrA
VKPLARRWLKFNFVGALGIVVQLAALALLVKVARLPYLWATALAVEIAVLHNFVWHEQFTWKDRTGKSSARDIALRLLRFQSGNGLISLGGNLLFMRLLVGSAGLRPLIANPISIALCAVLNFAVSEWFVFRK